LSGAAFEFYQIAWGTGIWLGQFALTWFLAFGLFSVFCLFILALTVLFLWQPGRFGKPFSYLAASRNRLGLLRWIVFVLLLLVPVYILQYTFWGVVLHGIYLRVLLVLVSCMAAGWLISKADAGVMDWTALLTTLVLTVGVLALFAPLGRVTSHPFSLGWSEGNRLWDYSVLFGRDVYEYPADQTIPVFLDLSRQFVGGIPFLLPNVTIEQVRLWLALVDVIPYLILGWAAFYLAKKGNMLAWMECGHLLL
jgi:hypothetical protein